MEIREINNLQQYHNLKYDSVYESVYILATMNNCGFCEKVKEHIDNNLHLNDGRVFYIMNLSIPELKPIRDRLKDKGTISFVPSLLRYSGKDCDPKQVYVDQGLYDELFEGTITKGV